MKRFAKTMSTLCSLVLATVGLNSYAEVPSTIRCTVDGIINSGTEINKLVICRYDEDPRNAVIIPSVNDGKFSCEIEASETYKYKIIDFGELIEKGMTSRSSDFFAEDGATIDIRIEGDDIMVSSTGALQQSSERLEQLAHEHFEPLIEQLENLPDSIQEIEMKNLEEEYSKWMLEYYTENPSLDFLFDLNSRLSSFKFFDKEVKPMLDIYNDKYNSKFYPNHSIHNKISDLKDSGLQMIGAAYHDYEAFDLEGNAVKAFDYIEKGKPTVVIIWATWCSPCRKEAFEMIPFYDKYHAQGVNFLGLAHEFKSTDIIKSVIDKDKHPWPTLLDLDDKYGIFRQHGTSSNGIYLIDGNGKIIAAAYNFKEIQPELDKLL